MTPELWQRLKPLYNEALDLPEEGRASFLAAMSTADTELARELRVLLAAAGSLTQIAPGNGSATHHSPFGDVGHWLPRHSARVAPGTVLSGRFRIIRHLGSGGMGEVYEASDEHLADGRIALKVIRPAVAGNPAALARFKDEVRLARKVSGPNVCRIHELHLTGPADSTVFLTMELLEGTTLHDHIEAAGPLPVPELRSIADQLCTALCCIHQAGIVHGDLKPRNVMLVPHNGTQRAVVMDFGLACVATEANKNADLDGFGSGVVAGTPGYMAPEQFEGCDLGPPTDIYALGLMLYEMATGIQPYAAHSPLAAAIRRSKPPTYASTVRHDLPAAWDDAIARCLQYDPKARFGSAAELSAALRRSPKVVVHLGHERRLALPKLPMLAVSAALVLVLAAGLWQAFGRPRHRELAPDAARWYAKGMTALREGSYMKATRLLAMVTERDPTYALAHAALADAWNELDFTEAAQHEMLLASASNAQRGLSELDRRYIDAVRSTLVRDYSSAAQNYEATLKGDPSERKADGYVDLGRIYDKAGRIHETLTAYEQAAALNPDDPAPFLHLGILRSRLRQPEAAQGAFMRAEALYGAESDQEGLAEVAYQRGYADNESGRYKQAKRYLESSLAIARQIPSVQLEVRSLSQLSSIAHREGQDDLAITYANDVTRLADGNGLEYWSTDGLIRLANAYMGRENFAAAEAVLQQAVGRARQNGHPRLDALAQLTLASLWDQQGRLDEQISLARSALRYYQDYGFLFEADLAETLILRGLRDKGEFQEALAAGDQLLGIAKRTNSPQNVATAEEFVGDVLLRLERYPEALTHFQQGASDPQSLGQDLAYLQLDIAEALVALGRNAEANDELNNISPEMLQRTDVGSSVAVLRARLRETSGDLRAASRIAQRTWEQYPSTHTDPGELFSVTIQAKAEGGHLPEARHDAAQLAADALSQSKNEADARAELLEANLALLAGDGPSARTHAQTAEQFFASKQMLESQALSLLAGAHAAQLTGDNAAAGVLSHKSVDIFRRLEQSWGNPAFTIYAGRPDRRKTFKALALLLGESGGLPNELSL